MPSSKRTMRSQCPVGYEPVDLNDSMDCPVVEDVLPESDSSSLWLIKVPHDFDMSSLSGQSVVLNGVQDLPSVSNKNKNKRYEVHSKSDVSAELSSFSVLLPSSQKKALCAASSMHGQVSVIRSVSVPPPTLPESSNSPTVQRQTHSERIKKWTPFGCRKPRRIKSKEKETKKPSERGEESADHEGRKKNKERETGNLRGTAEVESEEKEKSKRNSAKKKKKKKDKERHEFANLSLVKTEPALDATRNEKQNSPPPRKRKGSATDNCEDGEDANGVTPTKQRKENKTKNRDIVTVKQEGDADISGVKSVNEVNGGFDLARVKSEPRGTPKKAKKHSK